VGIRQEGTEASELEPRYDANGNLLNDDRNTYTWDADIHLLAVETGISSGAENGKPNTNKLRTKFAYDALHRRVARLEMRPKTGTPKTEHEQTLTHFIHDGWNVLEERSTHLNSQITHLKSHTWGHDVSGKPQGAGGIGGLLSSRNTETGTRANFHYDSNGNIVLLTDSEGNESARYAYDAFGKTMLATGPMAQENKYRFSTKPAEETSGLCYYGYRYYSPELGRWLSKDPIAERGGVNIYCLLNNDPTIALDKLGKEGVAAIVTCCVVVAGAIGGAYAWCHAQWRDAECEEKVDNFRSDCEGAEAIDGYWCELTGGSYSAGAAKSLTCGQHGYSGPCGGGGCTYPDPQVSSPES
jgi:RHS repeat-associated protein